LKNKVNTPSTASLTRVVTKLFNRDNFHTSYSLIDKVTDNFTDVPFVLYTKLIAFSTRSEIGKLKMIMGA